jgi:hypothetical protein
LELEVKGNEFYVLTAKQQGKITLYNEMDSPIKKIREYLRKGTSPEDIELVIVEIKEDKYEMKGVPWSTIATGLVTSE